ncbi:zinc finger protein 385C isoform X2 [Arapaima gigas]
MKRPCSSARLAGSARHQEDEGLDLRPESREPAQRRPRREKKHKTYTLCEVCNIQLNSPAQAQIHYSGKSHQKRLKQMSSGKQARSSGSPVHSSPLLASLPVPGRPLQPPLDLKRFLPFRLNGSSPLSLFPGFSTMDPVQKAVINHTFGVPQPLRKKQIISCNICHLRFNSMNQAEAHYKGHKHARKLKAMEAHKNKQRREREQDREQEKALPPLMDTEGTDQDSKVETAGGRGRGRSSLLLAPPSESLSASPASQQSDCPSDPGPLTLDGEPRKATCKQHLHCPVCKVTVNSTSQLEAHNSGSKHKLMLEGQNAEPRHRNKLPSSRLACKTKRLGGKGGVGTPGKAFHCGLCEIYVNSETQLKQHMNSRRHKDRLAGKPPRAKFSSYSKSPQSSLLARSCVCAEERVCERTQCAAHSSVTTTRLLQTKLALQKQLTKGLTAGFLPSALSPSTLCAVAASPLALRPPAGPAGLLQTPLLSPALFRPAPGPLRATHAPIIFSPY